MYKSVYENLITIKLKGQADNKNLGDTIDNELNLKNSFITNK